MHIGIEARTSNSWVVFPRHSRQSYMHKMPVMLPFLILANSRKAVNNRLFPNFQGTIIWLILSKNNCRIKDCTIMCPKGFLIHLKIMFSLSLPASLGWSSPFKIHITLISNKPDCGHSFINSGTFFYLPSVGIVIKEKLPLLFHEPRLNYIGKGTSQSLQRYYPYLGKSWVQRWHRIWLFYKSP